MKDVELRTTRPQVNATEIDNPRTWSTKSICDIEADRSRYGQLIRCEAIHPAYSSQSSSIEARFDVRCKLIFQQYNIIYFIDKFCRFFFYLLFFSYFIFSWTTVKNEIQNFAEKCLYSVDIILYLSDDIISTVSVIWYCNGTRLDSGALYWNRIFKLSTRNYCIYIYWTTLYHCII